MMTSTPRSTDAKANGGARFVHLLGRQDAGGLVIYGVYEASIEGVPVSDGDAKRGYPTT